MSTASDDVIAERERQKSAEGWTEMHDDTNIHGEMAGAAACYAIANVDHWRRDAVINEIWPWHEKWWKPKDRRRDLVRAGALIIAEIERLDRARKRDNELLDPDEHEALVRDVANIIRDTEDDWYGSARAVLARVAASPLKPKAGP